MSLSATQNERSKPLFDRESARKSNEWLDLCRRLARSLDGPKVKLDHVQERVETVIAEPIWAWCDENSEFVQTCFVEPVGDAVTVHVVTKMEKYDSAFGSAVTELTRTLLASGCLASVVQVPKHKPAISRRAPFLKQDSVAMIYNADTK